MIFYMQIKKVGHIQVASSELKKWKKPILYYYSPLDWQVTVRDFTFGLFFYASF